MSIPEFLDEIDAEIAAGWVEEKRQGDLSLFNYSKTCQLAGHWNKITRQCRGLIIDRVNLEIVARPFKKFFNLNENDWSTYTALPIWNDNEVVEVTNKMDGSLGIITKYKGELLVTTRGSFDSEQAIWAKKFIEEHWDVTQISPNHTYLAEIIYPENRIVVDYKGRKDVVLLAVVHTSSGIELNREMVNLHAIGVGAEVVPVFECRGFDHLLSLKGQLDFNTEGWVVHFLRTNQRVKIKTDDYMRLHRIISNLSPLAMWESMKDGKVNPAYLQQIPEEFKADVQWMQDRLELRYKELKTEIDAAWVVVRCRSGIQHPNTKAQFKAVALEIQALDKDTIKSGCFAYMRGRPDNVDQIILEVIRPTGNILENPVDATTDA